MKKLFLLVSCLFLLACTPEWQEYRLANGQIVLSLPPATTPLQSGQQVLQLGEREVTFESQMLSVGEQVYRLNYYQLQANDHPEQLVSALLEYAKKVLHQTEDTVAQGKHDYRLSSILSSVGKNNAIKVRILLEKDYLVFAYVFNNSERQFEEGERFLNSIQLP